MPAIIPASRLRPYLAANDNRAPFRVLFKRWVRITAIVAAVATLLGLLFG